MAQSDRSDAPLVTVIMPTFRQASFIRRALDSLLVQRLSGWELQIVDDGSPDETWSVVQPYLADPRIFYHRLERNAGLGEALNFGLEQAHGRLVAYLPSDDVYYADHLATLADCLEQNPPAALAFSGVRHHYNRMAEGIIPDHALQLVQVMHRLTAHRWLTRRELTTENLDWMLWDRLRPLGDFIQTGQVTCEWVDHPRQRSKILREPIGGLNTYRSAYQVNHPLRFHTSFGNFMDEEAHYARFRQRPDTPWAPDGLKILLVGELAYNPERILALEERGHQLFGLWMPEPYWYNTVGPLPFGHVQDLPREGWQQAVRRIQPDVIYALLNWQAVPFAHYVMENNPGIPFVWHYKEGPFISLEKGHWAEMVDLHLHSDGQIYSSPEMHDWYETVLPGSATGRNRLVLDGDLPKREWFDAPPSPRLSDGDGEIHTVVPGRPIGLHPPDVAALAQQGIHLHFYGDFTQGQWLEWIEKTKRLAPNHIHLHRHVDQEGWVSEFSQYEAGWLHFFESTNHGELRRANWDDLNYPARIATLIAAGLPLLQRDNAGSIVATQNLARSLDIGLFFKNTAELRDQLDDRRRLAQLRANVWRNRPQFTFDYHTDDLVAFFRQVISDSAPNWGKARGRVMQDYSEEKNDSLAGHPPQPVLTVLGLGGEGVKNERKH